VAIKGFGFCGVVSQSGKLIVGRPNSIEIKSDLTSQDVQGYPFNNAAGILQIVDSFAQLETFSCTLKTASFDKVEIQRMMDQFTNTAASIALPEAAQYTISATPFTIAVAGLTVDQPVAAMIESDTAPVMLTQTTTAPSTATQYQVTAGNVVFHSSQAGKVVDIQYNKTFTSVEVLGNVDNPVGQLMFFGKLIGTRFAIAPRIYIPKLIRRSGVSLGGAENTTEYRALLDSRFGKPILIAFDQA
jgi:hypothetical protein